mgnify:CR=1 FL=1
MAITEEIIEKTATLARLRIKKDEISGLKQDLTNILSHIDELSEVNTDGVEPTASIIAQENVFREDTVKQPFEDKDLLDLSPKTGHDHFMVPKVI